MCTAVCLFRGLGFNPTFTLWSTDPECTIVVVKKWNPFGKPCWIQELKVMACNVCVHWGSEPQPNACLTVPAMSSNRLWWIWNMGRAGPWKVPSDLGCRDCTFWPHLKEAFLPHKMFWFCWDPHWVINKELTTNRGAGLVSMAFVL